MFVRDSTSIWVANRDIEMTIPPGRFAVAVSRGLPTASY
jgi:hypothetical protein